MKRDLRTLIIVVAGCLVLAAVAASLGYALTRGDGPDMPPPPGPHRGSGRMRA